MQRDFTTAGLRGTLAAHHRHCGGLLAAAQDAATAGDWDLALRKFGQLRRALLEHFAFEEDELFPAFERGSGMSGPTQALGQQHKDIREILETLGAASPRHDPEGFRTEFATLAALLGQHIGEEEAIMYPAFERALAAAAPATRPDPAPAGALDVRGLPPPEPFMHIMEALSRAPDGPLRVLIQREPLPLYDVLQERGLSWHTRALGDQGFEVLIERSKG